MPALSSEAVMVEARMAQLLVDSRIICEEHLAKIFCQFNINFTVLCIVRYLVVY